MPSNNDSRGLIGLPAHYCVLLIAIFVVVALALAPANSQAAAKVCSATSIGSHSTLCVLRDARAGQELASEWATSSAESKKKVQAVKELPGQAKKDLRVRIAPQMATELN